MEMKLFGLIVLLMGLVCGYESITSKTFEGKVLSSGRVWLLEFYSDRCGSCQEFKPTFKSVVEKLGKKGIKIEIGMVGIDDKDAMKLAADLSVLDEGIPNLRLFSGDSNGIKIMSGDLLSATQVLERISTNLKGLRTDTEGFYLKPSDEL